MNKEVNIQPLIVRASNHDAIIFKLSDMTQAIATFKLSPLPRGKITTLRNSPSIGSRIDISINLDILSSWNYSKYSKPSQTLHALKS
jgi:hypothetical protein